MIPAHISRVLRWLSVAALLTLVAVPATGAPGGRGVPSSRLLAHVSQSVALRVWMAHPERAPAQIRDRLRAVSGAVARASRVPPAAVPIQGDRFNLDGFGLPQNEESVSVCRTRPRLVVGGTNDYRGLVDPDLNFTGWELSVDGGASVVRDGLLPPVSEGGTATRPSGGDPVVQFGREGDCAVYASSLNYDPFDPFGNTNGVGIYRTDAGTLLSPACGDDGLSDPDCWPTRRYAAFSPDPTHFFDKEWFDVGDTGDGQHVWVTWSDFTIDPAAPLGFTRAEILAARCDAGLTACTEPIPISEDDLDVQFSDVTIGPDKRTYVTWAQVEGELEFAPQTFTIKMRIAPPGSTAFGPEVVIHREELAIPFGGFLHANDWRVATYPKHAVRLVGGKPRVFVLWDACTERPLDSVCEEPVVKLRFSDDDGATWRAVRVLSAGGDNYFATIANDPKGPKLAAAWFTNRFDPLFHNRQDVELVSLDPKTGAVVKRRRLTSPSSEGEADPLLGGFFIGDYIEVAALGGVAYTHYNANYTSMRLLGLGVPVPQQDNYLTRAPL